MDFFKNIFSKKIEKLNTNDLSEANEVDLISDVRNWYSDRYETAIVQRNMLLLLLLISTCIILLGVFILGKVASSKSIDPFIVQIEEKTGVTNVVNPLNRRDLLTNEALNTYFVVKYLKAREAYDPSTFEYNYREVARVLSSPQVFRDALNYLNSPNGPNANKANLSATTVTVRSVQFLEPEMVQVRFTVETVSGGKKVYKIATIRFNYFQMEMNQNERLINPLGFRVTSYRSDNETL
jgi:type IV secretion system protein VirB8